MRPSRGIGEKHLNIAGPDILCTDLVCRPRIAGDPANDLKVVIIVERSRCQAFSIVDDQGNLGKIPGRPRRGTRKDHVLHAATAHGGRAVFAHHPAQRFQQVRLATAIRPHNAGQTISDDQIGWVDKAFKAVQSQFAKAQGSLPV